MLSSLFIFYLIMLDYQKDFISYALDCGVLKFGEFLLKSGRTSPYFFNTGLFNTGAQLGKLGHFYAQALLQSGIQPDILYGPAYKGIPLVSATSIAYAQITGGDGHFSLLGFSPVLVAGTAARWEVHFDDAGATADSTYEATLTFTSADEPLPGAAAQPDVHYLLSARVAADTIVAVEPALPALTRLYAPMPNPLTSGSTLRFDLARMTSARLEVFDLSGRRVALLADREFTPGRYDLRWDGRGETAGPLGSGLYFVRLTTRGLPPQTVRLAVVR